MVNEISPSPAWILGKRMQRRIPRHCALVPNGAIQALISVPRRQAPSHPRRRVARCRTMRRRGLLDRIPYRQYRFELPATSSRTCKRCSSGRARMHHASMNYEYPITRGLAARSRLPRLHQTQLRPNEKKGSGVGVGCRELHDQSGAGPHSEPSAAAGLFIGPGPGLVSRHAALGSIARHHAVFCEAAGFLMHRNILE